MLVVDDTIIPNSYDVSFTVTMHTEKVHEQNIVIERLRFFAEGIMSNSIMISHESPLLKMIQSVDFGNKYALFNDTPYDGLLCNILYLKASAILGDYATIESFSLSSRLGHEIDYYADVEDDFQDFKRAAWLPKNKKPWWMKDDISINDAEEDLISWTDLGLGWKEVKNDTETTIIPFPNPKFSPKVIQGGKNVS